jgi:hypothetical protein
MPSIALQDAIASVWAATDISREDKAALAAFAAEELTQLEKAGLPPAELPNAARLAVEYLKAVYHFRKSGELKKGAA